MIRFAIILIAFVSSYAHAVPVTTTGMAGYGFNDSGWTQSLIIDIEFDKTDDVQQFFKQTSFNMPTKPSAQTQQKPISSALLNGVAQSFNNQPVLRLNAIDEPSLLWLSGLASLCFVMVWRI